MKRNLVGKYLWWRGHGQRAYYGIITRELSRNSYEVYWFRSDSGYAYFGRGGIDTYELIP